MLINPTNSIGSAAYTQDASVQMLKKALDVQRQMGDAAVKLIESANLQDNEAGRIDIYV